MNRFIIFFVIISIVLGWCCINASAEENMYPSIANELEIDIESVGENIDGDVMDILEESNITPDNAEGVSSVTPSMVFKYIFSQVKDRFKAPIKDFAIILSIIIVSAVVMNFGDTLSNKSLEKIYSIISVMLVTGIISVPVSSSVSMTAETLCSGANFMIGYIPVFAGVTASSGCFTAAASYSTALLMIAESAVQLSSNIIMPVLSVCMALGVIEAVNPSFRLSSITDGMTKLVKMLLGALMTIFIGLLSIQSVIGASTDTIGVKAAKYLAANCIPVVGGAVADAYTTLKSSLGILRGGTGFFGIAVIFLTVMPVIIELGITRLTFAVSEIVSEVMGIGSIKTLLKNTSSILAIMLSLVVCFSMMLIISTALIMAIGLDVS